MSRLLPKIQGYPNSRRNFLGKLGLGSLLALVAGRQIVHARIFEERTKDEAQNAVWDPRDFGAKGDGTTLDTKALQAAIDSCHDHGGGKVYLHGGRFLSGTLCLKSHVTLHIEAGAMLLGSGNADDYPVTASQHPSYTGTYVTNKMLIYAENARNISIMGRGTINGQGNSITVTPYPRPSFSGRPRIIHFRGCENVRIRDITLTDSSSWVQSYQSCRDLLIDGITVDSETERRNNDGLDLVDCERVRISNCSISSGDDAIVLKSFSPGEACRDITISNCVLRSRASAIKLGTESAGAFEDITVKGCTVYETDGDAIAIETVDGARVERICISNISIRKLGSAPVFIRLGSRGRTYRHDVQPRTGTLRDIIIENIQGTQIAYKSGCSVTGLLDAPVENIILRNINLEFEGGGSAEDAERAIPENEKAYPSGRMFGIVPAYGFFIRHARNISIADVQLRFVEADQRPAFVCEDVEQLRIEGCRLDGTPQTPGVIRLARVREAIISGNSLRSQVPVFLAVRGGDSAGIYLLNNRLQKAGRQYTLERGAPENAVTVQ
jgi:polygalacturonase